MFARFRRFVWRNLGKIALGAVTVPILLKLTGYAARRFLTYQTTKTHSVLLRYRKQRMFEMMEENFEATFRKWYELMLETIKKTLNADHYAELLKKGGPNRMHHWTEMKIIAFANILALVHGAAMLSVILRIQVNVISGLLFKQMESIPPGLDLQADLGGGGDAVSEIARRRITDEVQQEYMILTRNLCTYGVQRLCELMQEKTRKVIENVSLKQKVNVEDLEQLFYAIRQKELSYKAVDLDNITDDEDVEKNDWCPIKEAWYYMMPVKQTKKLLCPEGRFWETETGQKSFIRELIGEAYDLVNASDSQNLLKFLESQGMNNYLDRISEFMSTLPPASDSSGESQLSETASTDRGAESEVNFTVVSAPLAKLIPVMNSFINVPFAEDTWAALLLHNQSLKSFSANIYESYSSKEFEDCPVPSTSYTEI